MRRVDFIDLLGILSAMLTLEAQKRSIFGKALRKSRGTGLLPAIIYGGKMEAESLFIDTGTFKKVWREAGESTIVSIKTAEGTKDTLIHDVSFHPVSGEPLHVDFYAIDTKKPIEVSVPLEFVGVSGAVKNLGGILVKVLHELRIEVLPKELPHSLSVDISKLDNIGDQLIAKDISLPSSASLVTNSEEVVAIISIAKEEEPEAGPVDLSAIELSEKKGKKEEEVIPEE